MKTDVTDRFRMLSGYIGISLEFVILITNSSTTLIYLERDGGIAFAMVAGTLSALSIAVFVLWTSAKKAWNKWSFLLFAIWTAVGIFLTY